MEPSLTSPAEAELQGKIVALSAQLAAERNARITNTVMALVRDGRLGVEEAPRAIARATADETYLEELRLRPAIPRAPLGIARCPQ